MTTTAQADKITELWNEAVRTGLTAALETDKGLPKPAAEGGVFVGRQTACSWRQWMQSGAMSTKEASKTISNLEKVLRTARKPNSALAGVTDVELLEELVRRMTPAKFKTLVGIHAPAFVTFA